MRRGPPTVARQRKYGRQLRPRRGSRAGPRHPFLAPTPQLCSYSSHRTRRRVADAPSSIFITVGASASFLASPPAARRGNYDVYYQSAATRFAHAVDDEITVSYRIGAGQDFAVQLFGKGCSARIRGMDVLHYEVRTADVTDEHDRLDVVIDLDKAAIATSSIWLAPRLAFCVRVQLLSEGSVANEHRQDLEIEFSLLSGFDAVEAQARPSLTQETQRGTANVASVAACKCDSLASFTWNTDPLGSDSLLTVCIESTDPDVEIEAVVALELVQDRVGQRPAERLRVVEGATIQDAALSSPDRRGRRAVVVATVVPARFFRRASDAAVAVQGAVRFSFGRRRRAAVHAGEADARTTGTARGQGVARPGYHDGVAPATEPDRARSTSDFEVTVGLAVLCVCTRSSRLCGLCLHLVVFAAVDARLYAARQTKHGLHAAQGRDRVSSSGRSRQLSACRQCLSQN